MKRIFTFSSNVCKQLIQLRKDKTMKKQMLSNRTSKLRDRTILRKRHAALVKAAKKILEACERPELEDSDITLSVHASLIEAGMEPSAATLNAWQHALGGRNTRGTRLAIKVLSQLLRHYLAGLRAGAYGRVYNIAKPQFKGARPAALRTALKTLNQARLASSRRLRPLKGGVDRILLRPTAKTMAYLLGAPVAQEPRPR